MNSKINIEKTDLVSQSQVKFRIECTWDQVVALFNVPITVGYRKVD